MKERGAIFLPALLCTALISLFLYRAFDFLHNAHQITRCHITDNDYSRNALQKAVEDIPNNLNFHERLGCSTKERFVFCGIQHSLFTPALTYGDIFKEKDHCEFETETPEEILLDFNDIKSPTTCTQLNEKSNIFVTSSNISTHSLEQQGNLKLLASAGNIEIQEKLSVNSSLVIISAGSIKIKELSVHTTERVTLYSLRSISIDSITGHNNVTILPFGRKDLPKLHPWLHPVEVSLWSLSKQQS